MLNSSAVRLVVWELGVSSGSTAVRRGKSSQNIVYVLFSGVIDRLNCLMALGVFVSRYKCILLRNRNICDWSIDIKILFQTHRWADKDYNRSHLGSEWKKPFAAASHAKGIVLEKM